MHCCKVITGDIFFAVWVNLGYFLPFYPLGRWKCQNFKKTKKPLKNIDSHFCRNIYDYCMFCCFIIACDGQVDRWANTSTNGLLTGWADGQKVI